MHWLEPEIKTPVAAGYTSPFFPSTPLTPLPNTNCRLDTKRGVQTDFGYAPREMMVDR